MTDDDRIAALRARCLERKAQSWVMPAVATARVMRATEGQSWQRRKGAVTKARLEELRFAIDDLELLVGRIAPSTHTSEEIAEANEYLATLPGYAGQTGHCELDREKIFRDGVDAMIAECRERERGATPDAADAYGSFADALEGFSRMCENAAESAESAQSDAVPWRVAELAAIAESCRRIAHGPPESFRDAIQLLWLMDLGTMHGESVHLVIAGHIDRTLRPFYERDVTAGVLDDSDALVLIEGLYLLTNEFVPDGLAMSVMVGGRDVPGADLTHRLSFLALEALRRTRLVYPTVGVCWHEGTPKELMDLAVELVSLGCPNPAFFGDETIQRGLRNYGLNPKESCNYINSTCVEITPVGCSNVWVASPYFSTPKILLEEIEAQVKSGVVAKEFTSFLDAYRMRLGARIAEAAARQNSLRERRREHGRKPLQSVFTKDCLTKGRDIDDGGAVCNWVECSFVGLANLADSLHVIRREVYEGALSLERLQQLLTDGFSGAEAEQERFAAHAKYGNGVAEVDGLVDDVVSFASGECSRQKMCPDDAHFVPGAFCWVMHERLGGECGATPDGRLAGMPFADGCGPAQGRERSGPTSSILSATSWDHSPLIGGAAYNMKFSRSLFESSDARSRLGALVLTFLRRGGFETQINVVDEAVLRAARKDPSSHRDLVVRIGGYTDYFVRLTPEMQDEVILRTEFCRL